MKCCIIGASPEVGKAIAIPENALVIAADAGYLVCESHGIKPDLAVGDFDSLGFVPDTETVRYPAEKDVTDMSAAIDEAIARGADELHIYGALGGRYDHTAANIQLLCDLSRKKIRALLYGVEMSAAAITDGTLAFEGEPGGIVSVFAADTAEGVTLAGMKYPLDGALLKNDFPLGVSNEFASQSSTVTVKRGTLIIFFEGVDKRTLSWYHN